MSVLLCDLESDLSEYFLDDVDVGGTRLDDALVVDLMQWRAPGHVLRVLDAIEFHLDQQTHNATRSINRIGSARLLSRTTVRRS